MKVHSLKFDKLMISAIIENTKNVNKTRKNVRKKSLEPADDNRFNIQKRFSLIESRHRISRNNEINFTEISKTEGSVDSLKVRDVKKLENKNSLDKFAHPDQKKDKPVMFQNFHSLIDNPKIGR